MPVLQLTVSGFCFLKNILYGLFGFNILNLLLGNYNLYFSPNGDGVRQ